MRIEKNADGSKFMLRIPVQSPAICDLQDKYSYRGYRNDYRYEITYTCGLNGMCFDADETRIKKFFDEIAPLVAEAEKTILDMENERDLELQRDFEEVEKRIERKHKKIESDKKNLSELKNFTGGDRIVFNTVLDECDPEFWLGKTGTVRRISDVSPNNLRTNVNPDCYRMESDNWDPIPGNSNRNITRFFGWRGTTDDRHVSGCGVRMVEKIVHFKNHARVYLSKYHPDYVD